jgi:hypothetical protein
MSINIQQSLTTCLSGDAKTIIIPAALFGNTGPAYDAINQFIQGQKLQLTGPGGSKITVTGSASSATVTGTGQNAPFGNTTVTATFTQNGNSVDIDITATIEPNWSISTAWPGELSGFPFSALEITAGTLTLTASVGDKNLALLLTVNASTYSGQHLSNGQAAGLLKVTYDNAEFGFAAGFVVTNNGWNPLSALGINDFTTISINEIGLFLTTIALGKDDLAAFQSLVSGGVAFLPKSVEPGLTMLAGLQMSHDVAVLGELFSGNPTLQLTGFVQSATDTVSLSAELDDVTIGTVDFQSVILEWDSSPEAKSVSLTVTSVINAPPINLIDGKLAGSGKLVYSTPQSATFNIEMQGWNEPFGIQNLAIDDFGLDVVLQDSVPEVAVNLGGQITIGSGATAATVIVAAGVTLDGDLPAPSGLVFVLQPADQGKTVTLADVIDDVASVFGAHFDVTGTLLNDISIAEIKVAVVQVAFTFNSVTYQPFISIVGDIFIQAGSDKFELDMMLTVNTQASPPYLQACGTVNMNGGPISIDIGSTNVLTMSNAAGNKGPAACVDTLALTAASNFCGTTCTAVSPGGTGYFLVADAKISVLNLISESIYAKVAKDSFDFQTDFQWFGGAITTELSCTYLPSESEFAAAIEFDADMGNITLDWGFIGKFTIPTPSVGVCVALGTFVPQDPVFNQGTCSGWKPSAAPYFYFDGDFSWGSLSWGFSISIDANDFAKIATAFTDFGTFLLNWIESNVAAFLSDIISSLESLLNLLYKLGWAMWDAVKGVYDFFADISWSDVFAAAEKIWADIVDDCAQSAAEAAYSQKMMSAKPLMMPALGALAESDGGQDILFHYYLHQNEIEDLMRSDRESGRRVAKVLQQHLANESVAPTDRHVPAVTRALSQLTPFASSGLKQSIAAVSGQLHEVRNLDHPSLMKALAG